MIVFPPTAQFIIGTLSWLMLFCAICVCQRRKTEWLRYQTSLTFLFVASLTFLILPLSWASAAPWHHSLTLVCLSLAMGFSIDYFLYRVGLRKIAAVMICMLIAAGITLTAIPVNQENINKYLETKEGPLGFGLTRNAVLHPPNIQNKLRPDSLIIVEDSLLQNDYFLGNAAYPFQLFFTGNDYDKMQLKQRYYYLTFHHTYSGTLFRYAYLMPTLKEELFPFRVEKMDVITNEIIYNWLAHYYNLFCLGYDKNANWYDKTDLFKKNLLKIQSERRLAVHPYQSFPVNVNHKMIAYSEKLAIPDAQHCQFVCDQDRTCKGFVYSESYIGDHLNSRCDYYQSSYLPGKAHCPQCMAYEQS
jgi:hypothetical protein